jgi:hypothetical protein
MLLAACASSGPCDGEPGVRVHVALACEVGGWDLGGTITYANGHEQRITLRAGEYAIVPGGVEWAVAYPPGAVSGPAALTFYACQLARAQASFTADLGRCVTVEATADAIAVDAGP